MKHIHRVFSIPGLFFFGSLALAQGMDPLDFAGEWRGRWENLTFGSKDSASLTVTADTALKTLGAVLDLDGNVFGGSDPAPITLTGTYDDAGFSVSGNQAPYGDLSLSGDTDGTMSGRAPDVPNPGIDSVSLNGTYDQLAISMTYVVYFTFGGTADGILTMEKQAIVGVEEIGPVLPSAFSLSR
ncbi:MAG TPA: hypothetical protein VI932_10295, partial [Bacteroidota bacterium]|nr:hypothetical protein [Bacteroidota bacterium]